VADPEPGSGGRPSEPQFPEPLAGAGRVVAPLWIAAAVLLYLAVRELGASVVP